MGERPLQANGRNHDGKSVGNTSHGTRTDHHPASKRIVLSSLLALPNQWRKWFEENPLRNEEDEGTPDQQPLNRQIPSNEEEEDWEGTILRSRISGQMTSALSRECKRECTIQIAPMNMKRKMRNSTESTSRATSDPPDLVEENEDLEGQQMNSTRSTSMELQEKVTTYNSMTDEGNGIATHRTLSYRKQKKCEEEEKSTSSINDDKIETEIEMVDFFKRELAIIEMNRNEKTQYIQQHIGSCLGLMKNEVIGAAKELEALLRRCIYPKRDVIRWI